MTALLIPPVTTPLTLLLYELEQEWYLGFARWNRKTRTTGARPALRSKIFPTVLGWRDQLPEDNAGPSSFDDRSFVIVESIREHVRQVQRARFLRHSRSDGSEDEIDARLVLFEGGMCAFLGERYRAKVATHLLETKEARTNAELEIMPVHRLKHSDALLFRTGTDSDVIRSVADTMLPSGTRTLSGLWKRVLRAYMEKERISVETLRERLNSHGCPLGAQAIRNWISDDDLIAPLAYGRDVAAIAELTNDADLCRELDNCRDAIAKVRSAHLRASNHLARQVIAKAVELLREGNGAPHALAIDEDVVLVRVEDVDDTPVRVRQSLANRLLEGSQWQE
jgi:hypothetical protein